MNFLSFYCHLGIAYFYLKFLPYSLLTFDAYAIMAPLPQPPLILFCPSLLFYFLEFFNFVSFRLTKNTTKSKDRGYNFLHMYFLKLNSPFLQPNLKLVRNPLLPRILIISDMPLAVLAINLSFSSVFPGWMTFRRPLCHLLLKVSLPVSVLAD